MLCKFISDLCDFCLDDVQIDEMKKKIKDMEVDFADNKRRENALEMKLKQTKQMYESIRSERNVLSKNLLTANVITPSCYLSVILLFKEFYFFTALQ